MSLLTIVQSVTQRLALPSPTIVVGNSDSLIAQIYALVNEEGSELSLSFDWQQLTNRFTITADGVSSSFALPTDYNRPINQTFWDNSKKWPLIGPISPQTYEWIQNGIAVAGPRRRFRIWQGRIFLDAVPPAGNVFVFEYVTGNWAADVNGNPKGSFTADTDSGRISEGVIAYGARWRFLKSKGLAYEDDYNTYQNAVSRLTGGNMGGKLLSLDVPDTQEPPLITPWNVPDTGYGS